MNHSGLYSNLGTKLRFTRLLVACFALCGYPLEGKSAFEFSGFISLDGKVQVCLSHQSDGYLGWFQVGRSYEKFEIMELKTEPLALVLSTEAGPIEIPIKRDRIGSRSKPSFSGLSRNSDADISFDASLIMVSQQARERRAAVAESRRTAERRLEAIEESTGAGD